MKRQTSKSKLQGNIKLQASKLKSPRTVHYPEPRPSGLVLNDGPNGEGNGRHPFDAEARKLYREGNELHLILANIYHKTK